MSESGTQGHAEPQGHPDAVRSVSENLARLHRGLSGLKHQMTGGRPTAGDGVEWAAFGLLVHLVKDGPQRSSALADTACVDPSTVSRQVAQLVTAGLVERQSDPEDGRASLLVATARGDALFAEKQAHRTQLMGELLGAWPDRDLIQLAELLDRLNTSIATHRAAMSNPPTTSPPSLDTLEPLDLESR